MGDRITSDADILDLVERGHTELKRYSFSSSAPLGLLSCSFPAVLILEAEGVDKPRYLLFKPCNALVWSLFV